MHGVASHVSIGLEVRKVGPLGFVTRFFLVRAVPNSTTGRQAGGACVRLCVSLNLDLASGGPQSAHHNVHFLIILINHQEDTFPTHSPCFCFQKMVVFLEDLWCSHCTERINPLIMYSVKKWFFRKIALYFQRGIIPFPHREWTQPVPKF